jgi:hypothetical protein
VIVDQGVPEHAVRADGRVTIAGVFDRSSGGLTIAFLSAMAIFWAVNYVYQIAIPFPLPASMVGIRWGLILFAAFMTLLYVGVLVATSQPDVN